MKKISKPYGTWPSPITPERIGQGLDFSDLAWNEDGTLVWRERRSDRGVVALQPPGESAFRELNSTFSISAGVGYGGGDFTAGLGKVIFVDKESKRLFQQPLGEGSPQAITPAFGSAASPRISPHGEYVLFVHSYEGQDTLAVVDLEGKKWPRKLVEGSDFYMHPRWSPEGKHIAWIEWDHPNMPWDGTRLALGEVRSSDQELPRPGNIIHVAGDEKTSIFQPEFSPDGKSLAYISDQEGWWQLYLYDLESGEHRQLTEQPAEHGLPAWVQEMRTYTFSGDGKSIYVIRFQEGFSSLVKIDLAAGKEHPVQLEPSYTHLEQISAAPRGDHIALIASSGVISHRIITIQNGKTRVIRRSTPEDLPGATFAEPQAVSFPTTRGETAHGLYYPPNHPRYAGKGTPPLLVLIHGGPTSHRSAEFSPLSQFFATRGYAVLQPNYRGSTGYGRPYRDALKGEWGVLDVEDAVEGARHLAQQGLADPNRLVIMGGSAGGFTVLKALEDHPGFFRAGICMYGVANQFTLAADTHKFEAHYLDTLLGPLPEASDLYRERSPIFFADQIRDAIAVFQGEEDQVVPKDQSETIVAALKDNGVPHIYHLYPGEGHGFRKSETLEHFYKAVEDFLKQYVIFA